MSSGRSYFGLFRLLSAATLLALPIFWPQTGLAQGRTGDVYVLTNQSTGNSVVVFHRDPEHFRFRDLTFDKLVSPTGGLDPSLAGWRWGWSGSGVVQPRWKCTRRHREGNQPH